MKDKYQKTINTPAFSTAAPHNAGQRVLIGFRHGFAIALLLGFITLLLLLFSVFSFYTVTGNGRIVLWVKELFQDQRPLHEPIALVIHDIPLTFPSGYVIRAHQPPLAASGYALIQFNRDTTLPLTQAQRWENYRQQQPDTIIAHIGNALPAMPANLTTENILALHQPMMQQPPIAISATLQRIPHKNDPHRFYILDTSNEQKALYQCRTTSVTLCTGSTITPQGLPVQYRFHYAILKEAHRIPLQIIALLSRAAAS